MKNLNDNLVVGLVGNAGAGKDFVASIFEEMGFSHYSGSDIVREEIDKRGLLPSRETQTLVANEVRLLHGGDYFVVRAIDRARKLRPEAPILVSGIYAPAEGTYISVELHGDLVDVVTADKDDLDVRFERITSRSDGSRDLLSRGEFVTAHNRENSGTNPLEANVTILQSLARFTIINGPDATSENLAKQVKSILDELGQEL